MRRPVYSIIISGLLALSLSLYSSNIIRNSAVDTKSKEEVVTVQNIQGNTLQIINETSTLKKGEAGVITIQGKPNTKYIIETSYSISGKSIAVKQWRITDSSGRAAFNWVVDNKTDAGTRKAFIYGGGERIETSHTVTP